MKDLLEYMKRFSVRQSNLQGITLAGGFACSITPEESNAYTIYMRETEEYRRLLLIEGQMSVFKNRIDYDEDLHNELLDELLNATEGVYNMSEAWYKNLLAEIDAKETEELAKTDAE